MRPRRRYIRELVEGLLADLDVVGPPIDVAGVARALGATVRAATGDEDLSGFLLRDSTGAMALIGVNHRDSPQRQRFTVAHEIGHLLLHENEGVHVDAAGNYRAIARRADSSEQFDPREVEANAFAAELLMPASLLEIDLFADECAGLPDEAVIEILAERYGVSTAAMTYRLANLGYLVL